MHAPVFNSVNIQTLYRSVCIHVGYVCCFYAFSGRHCQRNLRVRHHVHSDGCRRRLAEKVSKGFSG